MAESKLTNDDVLTASIVAMLWANKNIKAGRTVKRKHTSTQW